MRIQLFNYMNSGWVAYDDIYLRKVENYTHVYDAENRLVSVTGATTATFVYDGDGNRVQGEIGGVTTTYIGNYAEWIGGESPTLKKYYYAGATRVAMHTGTELKYLLGDHLGSTAITATSTGVLDSEVRYYPWGTDRYTYSTTPTTYRFTGQRNESGIGLYFYGARWYDASAGRFIQPDTLIPQQQGVQAWDRYAYVNNNPVKYIDPAGHDLEQIIFNKRGELPKQSKRPQSSSNSSSTSTPMPSLTATQAATTTPFDANLGGSNESIENGNNNDTVATLKFLATATQDIATIIDLAFAIPEVIIGTIGVVSVGPETLPVTVGTMDILFNVFLGNLAETSLSFVSLGFTATADFLDDGQFGDATITSAVTFGFGLGMSDPIGDLVIDSYASGYNHGIFSGFMDLLNGAPFFSIWP